MTNRLSHFISTIMIMALLLTGAVPSFAWAETEEEAAPTDSVVLPAITIDQSDAPTISGKSGIIMDAETGTVLYEKNADLISEPASVTKVLTLLLAVENLELDQVITVPEGVKNSGTTIWLEEGEKITVKDLLYGMMLESANDAAEVLGRAMADGDIDKFAEMMNERAIECGAQHSDFRNPNGLNEDADRLNYTTARDLALIVREGMSNPVYRKVVKTTKYIILKTNKSDKRTLINSNACLWNEDQHTEINGEEVPFKYKGCNGVKTGYTSSAGFCYVGSAKRKGTDFIVVTLNCPDSENRFRDAMLLWNYAFGKYQTYSVMKKGEVAGVRRVWGGEKRNVEVGIRRDLGVTIEKGTADQQAFTTEFRLDEDRLEAPVEEGQKMGEALVFNAKGRLVGKDDLYALTAIAEGGPLSKIGIADEDLPLVIVIAVLVLICVLIALMVARRRRKKVRKEKRESIKGKLSTMRTAGVGMTAKELTDVTGKEEIVPIPKGPARISNEELTAWSSTKRRPSAGSQRGQQTEQRTPRGQRTPADQQKAPQKRQPSSASQQTGRSTGSYPMPKMNITPRTPLTGGMNGGPAPRRRSMSDEELFNVLESTEVYDVNQPRRHGKLTTEERQQVMRSEKSEQKQERSGQKRFRRRRKKRRPAPKDGDR